jgi:hypothetical protein
MAESMSPLRAWVGTLFLLPLAIVAVKAKAFVPQSSFHAWVVLELTILASAALAIGFSLFGIRRRSGALKLAAIGTAIVALLLGPLEAFWFL